MESRLCRYPAAGISSGRVVANTVAFFFGLLGRVILGLPLLLPLSMPVAASLQTPAMTSSLASKAMLTASARAGDRMVAVGAYGNIVYSVPAPDGKGMEWRQGKVPTQRLLTTVTFVDEREGWAGGHDSLILHTTDGGENWEIQHEDSVLEGDELPRPILDIEFTDKLNGIAIGAYSLMLATADGGKTWKPLDTSALYARLESLDLEPEPNFNAILKLSQGDDYLIVGELGTLLLYNPKAASVDDVWRVVSSPYVGSFFGAEQLSSGQLLIYGLRGHVFQSTDRGLTWSQINTGTVTNVNDAIELESGDVVLVGEEGSILRLPRGASAAEKIPFEGFSGFSSVQSGGGNRLLLFGGAGAQVFAIK